MKKLIVTCMIFASCMFAGKAMAQAYETTAEMKSGYQNAVSIDVPYTPDEAEKALEKRFAKKGLKGKNFSKGFTEYKNVKFDAFGSSTMTIYTKVEAKDKKKTESKVYVLVSLIEGEFCSSATCEAVISNVKDFLDSFEPHVALYNTSLLYDTNTKAVQKAEKELRNLQDDSSSLQKDKEKILKKIDENTQAIASKEKEIEMKKQVLQETLDNKTKQEKALGD